MEALGVVWAVQQYRPHLYGHYCTVFMDHEALRSLMNTPHPSKKLARVRVGPTGACPAHPIDQEGTMPMLMLSPVSHSWTHPQNIVAAVTDNCAAVKNREPDLTVAKRQTTDHKPSAADAQSLPRKSDSSSGWSTGTACFAKPWAVCPCGRHLASCEARQVPACHPPCHGPWEPVDVLQLSQSHQGNRYAVVFIDYLTKWPEVFLTSLF